MQMLNIQVTPIILIITSKSQVSYFKMEILFIDNFFSDYTIFKIEYFCFLLFFTENLLYHYDNRIGLYEIIIDYLFVYNVSLCFGMSLNINSKLFIRNIA